MEGKAVLFKKFADIDCFDLEINESDPRNLQTSFAPRTNLWAVNLEDIKAPDCFELKICRSKMNIPVFHDDVWNNSSSTAAKNALLVASKQFDDIKIVSTGAAGIACRICWSSWV